jgi:adenylylsulfate reductase subunit A
MYRTNGPMLERALQQLAVFKEDLEHLGARNLHELLRCWEMWDRTQVAEANVRHMLFREETRWPGYYYRLDFPKLDDANWRAFVNSRFDADSGDWELEKVPFASNIP